MPSEQNPADDVSHGLTAIELVKNKRWISRPNFLQSGEALSAMKAVSFNAALSDDSEDIPEMRIYARILCDDDNLIDTLIRKFSDWYRQKVWTD